MLSILWIKEGVQESMKSGHYCHSVSFSAQQVPLTRHCLSPRLWRKQQSLNMLVFAQQTLVPIFTLHGMEKKDSQSRGKVLSLQIYAVDLECWPVAGTTRELSDLLPCRRMGSVPAMRDPGCTLSWVLPALTHAEDSSSLLLQPSSPHCLSPFPHSPYSCVIIFKTLFSI